MKQNGQKVNHVVLPQWTAQNPYSFIIKHRKMLEG